MSKPILLIDIDGVIIPHKGFTVDECSEDTHTMFLYDYAGEGWMKIRNDFPEIMQKLMPHFDLMWGSGWEEEGNYFLLEVLGLEEDLDWVPLKQSLPGSILGKLPVHYYWKTPWIIDWAEKTGRPFALIDDLFSSDDFEYAERRTAEGIPTLFVQTKDTIGWTDEHTDQLIAWAEGIKDGESEIRVDGAASRPPEGG